MSQENETTPIRPKFDALFYKAALLRLILEPHLCVRFKDYLHEQLFDTGDGNGSLRTIARVLLEWIRTSSETPTVEGIWGRLQLLPDGEARESTISVFNQLRTDEELHRFSQSDQVFRTFLQWLKATAFIKEFPRVKEKFNSGSFDQAYDNLEKTLLSIKGISLDDVEDADWGSSLDFLETESMRADRKFHIGIEDFDLQSGFEPQMLGLFVAGTGSGKTQMSVHLVRKAIEQQKHIYLACVEDRKVTILRRIYSCLTGIPMDEIKRLCDMTPENRKKMYKAAESLAKYVTVEFMYGVPLDFILSRVKEHQAIRRSKGIPPYEVMVIDYLQHIAHLSPGDSSHEKLSLSMAKYKDFVLQHNLVGITHQQVNRTGVASQNKEALITMAEMSASFQAAFVADVIISLNRTTEMKERDESVWYVCKGREGSVENKYQVKTEFDKARFNTENYLRLDRM